MVQGQKMTNNGPDKFWIKTFERSLSKLSLDQHSAKVKAVERYSTTTLVSVYLNTIPLGSVGGLFPLP